MRHDLPDALIMQIPGLSERDAEAMAKFATAYAKRIAPKMSGQGAASLEPVWGDGWFGMAWTVDYLWYQEEGIQPFTMHSLQGKVIPLWVDDPRGKVARENPKAKRRTTASGKKQVLLFRRAARKGQRKTIRRRGQTVSVPRSYPGAPGRIVQREAAAPWTTPGRIGGRIARGNVGVRWRHPGLVGRGFMRRSLEEACIAHSRPRSTITAIRRTTKVAA